MITAIEDLKAGDAFSFPTSLGVFLVTDRVEHLLVFRTKDGLFPTRGEVDVQTGKGKMHIPDYMLWHIHIGETLTRKEYTQEEKEEARRMEFPLFVELIGG